MPRLRRAIVATHRWLGIAGGLLFVVWFASGIAMVYARMPRLSAEERLQRLPPLALDTVGVTPHEAARHLQRPPQRVRLGMLEGRPVYRFHDGVRWTTVFADSGGVLIGLDAWRAVQIASELVPEHAETLRYDARLEEPDQWTLQIRALLPAHRIALHDPAGSYLYIADSTGEPVLLTTRSSRAWGYVSAVLHWLYFTPLRQNGPVWTQVIVWTSVAGCVLCLSGLVWGIWQFARLRDSPYQGLMRWHHYTGLAFGVVTFTFVFSGLLSMNPWGWPPSSGVSRAQREAVAGGPLHLDPATVERLREAAAVLAREFPIKEIELVQFRGELFAAAYRAPAPGEQGRTALDDPGVVLSARLPLEQRLVALAAPRRGAFERFADEAVSAAARAAMPTVAVQDETWLTEYDAYYYDRDGTLPLPVLRVRFADAAGTWLYLDPYRGAIVRHEERVTRLNRWIYHGLHSLDVPWLYQRRPLWDIVIVGLSLGGLVVSLTSAPAGWRRLLSRASRTNRRAGRRHLNPAGNPEAP